MNNKEREYTLVLNSFIKHKEKSFLFLKQAKAKAKKKHRL
jgi:hypothetical protein